MSHKLQRGRAAARHGLPSPPLPVPSPSLIGFEQVARSYRLSTRDSVISETSDTNKPLPPSPPAPLFSTPASTRNVSPATGTGTANGSNPHLSPVTPSPRARPLSTVSTTPSSIVEYYINQTPYTTPHDPTFPRSPNYPYGTYPRNPPMPRTPPPRNNTPLPAPQAHSSKLIAVRDERLQEFERFSAEPLRSASDPNLIWKATSPDPPMRALQSRYSQAPARSHPTLPLPLPLPLSFPTASDHSSQPSLKDRPVSVWTDDTGNSEDQAWRYRQTLLPSPFQSGNLRSPEETFPPELPPPSARLRQLDSSWEAFDDQPDSVVDETRNAPEEISRPYRHTILPSPYDLARNRSPQPPPVPVHRSQLVHQTDFTRSSPFIPPDNYFMPLPSSTSAPPPKSPTPIIHHEPEHSPSPYTAPLKPSQAREDSVPALSRFSDDSDDDERWPSGMSKALRKVMHRREASKDSAKSLKVKNRTSPEHKRAGSKAESKESHRRVPNIPRHAAEEDGEDKRKHRSSLNKRLSNVAAAQGAVLQDRLDGMYDTLRRVSLNPKRASLNPARDRFKPTMKLVNDPDKHVPKAVRSPAIPPSRYQELGRKAWEEEDGDGDEGSGEGVGGPSAGGGRRSKRKRKSGSRPGSWLGLGKERRERREEERRERWRQELKKKIVVVKGEPQGAMAVAAVRDGMV